MLFSNPRRRLLITAPLAIILPAGLIIWCGFKVVGVVEMALEPVISGDLQGHKAIIEQLLKQEMKRRQREFTVVVRMWADERLSEQSLNDVPERFVLRLPLPYIQWIYRWTPEGSIAFYAREQDAKASVSRHLGPLSNPSVWRLSAAPSETIVDKLQDRMEEDIGLARLQESPAQIESGIFVRSDENVGYFLGSNTVFLLGKEVEPLDEILAVGIVFDLDYVREHILVPLIHETRILPIGEDPLGMGEYPLEVLDEQNRVIAESAPGQPGLFDEGYSEYVLNFRLFPFWRIRYAKDAGVRKCLRLEEIRGVTVPLIITAAVIMVLAIIQMIQNLRRELNLADLRASFVARVSHELRTPLGLIRLFAETLEMGRIQDPERGREYLHTITRESERLSKLIDNVLDFSKIEAGQKQYQLSLGSVADVVKDVSDSMRFHMSRNNLDLQVRIESNLPMVRLDREAIAQALWNLLSNAAKYSGDGRLVEVDAHRADGEVVVSVRDHGIGIAPTEVKKLCQQFYRVDDPRVRERGGSGLGLSVVKHIMEGHHGRLTIDSAPGEGSAFSLHIPIPGSSPDNKENSGVS